MWVSGFVIMKLKMMNPLPFVLTLLLFCIPALSDEGGWSAAGFGPVVARDQRKSLIVTAFGEVSAVDVNVGHRGPYHLQFFTLEPNSLFLPVLLHVDMIFYTHTGSGRLTWADEGDKISVDIRKGDIHRIPAGSVFYVQSDLETAREKLRIYAIFDNSDEDHKSYEPAIGAYSSVTDLIKGFDKKILKAAFRAPEEVVEAIINSTMSPGIVHSVSTEKSTFWEFEARFMKALVGGHGAELNKKKKKRQTYNIFDEKPDFQNCNGWSLTVNGKNFKSLRHTDIGLLMVNLSTNSMMGPHWNPLATEIAIVLHGQGMVRTVCSSSVNKSQCRNTRFKVKEGDVFTVPRFHAMAHISYSNESLVFVGFSTTKKRNYPQFVAGKTSVLQKLDNEILAWSFNVSVQEIEQLLAAQTESIILECLACAEEEERLMVEEEERKRQEEEEERRRKEEEEARRREEEKRREEEETRKREEEERKRQKEEARRREEEERKRQEEEVRRREEEERKRQEEEARREEEERKRQEEEARREEEERRRQEEEAARKKEEWESEREKRRKQEEEAEREQEEARREAEETARKREDEKEREERRKQEEAKREQEEARREAEEEAQKEEEEARRAEEERERMKKQEEEARRREEEESRRQEKEQAKREEEKAGKQAEEMEERERQEEKETTRQREEEKGKRHEEWELPEWEEEARRQQEQKRREEEEKKQGENGNDERKGRVPQEWTRTFKFLNI